MKILTVNSIKLAKIKFGYIKTNKEGMKVKKMRNIWMGNTGKNRSNKYNIWFINIFKYL